MRTGKSWRAAHLGLLFSLALVLAFLESAVAPLLGLMPAMKLGLSNIVVMFALLFLGKRPAYALVALKALFAFLTRGGTAGFLSFLGGNFSFAVLALLLLWPGRLSGYVFSACGALAHNAGQLAGAALLLSSRAALGYAPVLMAAALCVGGVTWGLFKALMPYLARLAPGEGKENAWKKLR